MGQVSSVGIVTQHMLDDLGIESQWGQDFLHPSRPALGPTQPPIYGMLGFSRGVNWLGHGIDHPPCLLLRLKKE
jgi:hypothetical protein